MKALEERTSQPDFWNDQEAAQAVLRDRKRATDLIDADAKLTTLTGDIETYIELAAAETNSTVIVRDVDSLRRRIAAWRRGNQSVALVPTMGALHKGHLTLMTRAQQMADRVVATIFVNPKQFGPREDLAAYPRQESADYQMLAAAGVHLLFAPDAATMYH